MGQSLAKTALKFLFFPLGSRSLLIRPRQKIATDCWYLADDSKESGEFVGREIDGGRYHVRELIGHGGMASVYLAHQISVDRMVAIKFIQTRLLIDENLKKRFHREAPDDRRIECFEFLHAWL
jgi:serine/threonine protein kinase